MENFENRTIAVERIQCFEQRQVLPSNFSNIDLLTNVNFIDWVSSSEIAMKWHEFHQHTKCLEKSEPVFFAYVFFLTTKSCLLFFLSFDRACWNEIAVKFQKFQRNSKKIKFQKYQVTRSSCIVWLKRANKYLWLSRWMLFFTFCWNAWTRQIVA